MPVRLPPNDPFRASYAEARDGSVIDVAALEFDQAAKLMVAWLDGIGLAYTTGDLIALTALQIDDGIVLEPCGAATMAHAWLERRGEPYTGSDLAALARLFVHSFRAIEDGGPDELCEYHAEQARLEAENEPRH